MKYSTRAIVLSTEDFGEADCYVQFLTQDWGVISTLAKSARKSKKRYVGGLDLFCHNEIFLRGDPRERPYLQELSVLNTFSGLREELEKILSAGKLVQWVKKLANIPTPMPSVYRLLGQTLALLEREPNPERYVLLELVFKLKLLALLGMKPRLDSCIKCDTETDTFATFDLSQGGILCMRCLPKHDFESPEMVSFEERSFLHACDDLKMSLWSEVQAPSNRLPSLHRIVTQFASFQAQTKLPF